MYEAIPFRSSSESLRPGIGRAGSRITAAATTGPASGPRPASSIPQIRPLASAERREGLLAALADDRVDDEQEPRELRPLLDEADGEGHREEHRAVGEAQLALGTEDRVDALDRVDMVTVPDFFES